MDSSTELIDTALVTGGAGGIGKALAKYLISKGKKVIIAGRTESKLRATAKELDITTFYVLDTGDTKSIPSFVARVTKEHPGLNCLVNNAGVQQPFHFPGSGNSEYDFDLAKADAEIDINIRGPMHLIVELLPHFTSLDKPSVVINVSSALGFSPFITFHPVYNATKAWLHSFSVNLRTQFAQNRKIKVVEIVPPSVETDLHRDRTDPDDNKKSKNSAVLSMDEFMSEVIPALERGDDVVAAGMANDLVDAWQDSLGARYDKAVNGTK